jgi:hypothetical protein
VSNKSGVIMKFPGLHAPWKYVTVLKVKLSVYPSSGDSIKEADIQPGADNEFYTRSRST